MAGYNRKGILRVLRGDGSLIRALMLALALQIVMPMLGILPGVQAAPAGAISVCTAHGIITLVPDGQGGWTQQEEPKAAGISCAFCLPLLSGNAGPVVDIALPMPAPAHDEPVFVRLALAPVSALPPGSASPRAPPTIR